MSYVYLIAAILCDTFASIMLKRTDEFKNIGLTVLVLAAYAVSFYLR
jgi:multidrug transporter EmrE-like cation transporter